MIRASGPALRRAVAGAGGIGRAGPAPGTVASLVAVVSGAGLLALGGRAAVAIAAIAATAAGLACLRKMPEARDDPGWVVIDEFAGQWAAMLWLRRPSAAGLAASFAAFRALDIAKPGPIGWIDRRRGAAGVMLDDVLAGIVASAGLAAASRLGRANRAARR